MYVIHFRIIEKEGKYLIYGEMCCPHLSGYSPGDVPVGLFYSFVSPSSNSSGREGIAPDILLACFISVFWICVRDNTVEYESYNFIIDLRERQLAAGPVPS